MTVRDLFVLSVEQFELYLVDILASFRQYQVSNTDDCLLGVCEVLEANQALCHLNHDLLPASIVGVKRHARRLVDRVYVVGHPIPEEVEDHDEDVGSHHDFLLIKFELVDLLSGREHVDVDVEVVFLQQSLPLTKLGLRRIHAS